MTRTEHRAPQMDGVEGDSGNAEDMSEASAPDTSADATAGTADLSTLEAVHPADGSESAPTSDTLTGSASASADDDSAPTVPPAPAPTHSSGGSAGSMIIGGVLSAAIGAAAALALLPEGWRPHDTSALDRRISALETQGSGLQADDLTAALSPLDGRLTVLESTDIGARLGALETVTAPDLAPLIARIDALEAGGLGDQELAGALAPLHARMDQIEADIAAQAEAAVSAALAQARAEVEAQAAALTSRETDVAAAQELIAARAALADLTAAAESGEAQAGALTTLAAVADVPSAMSPFADGLDTLAALQDSFAPAARAALAADAPPADAGVTDRLFTFLRSQTGARSLAPRDGDDADAVLSRAEATLRQGDLQATLAELARLSGGPADAMANWQATAQTRVDALTALDALQSQLTRIED